MNERLRKWVKPDIDSARLARQWSAIEPRANAPSSTPARWWVAPAALVVLASIAGVIVMRREKSHPQEHVMQVPKAIAVGVGAAHVGAKETTFDLRDGSHVIAELGAEVAFSEDEHETRCELRAGAVDFDVKHDPSRAFVVVAGGVRVVDVGTHFRVEYGAEHDVRVTVREGVVRVERDAEAPTEVHGGEAWTSRKAPLPETSASAPLPVPSAMSTQPSRLPSLDDEIAFSRFVSQATPKQLFELGDAARLSNHPRQAALAFDALRTRYRDDARAGLAAMDLGRLRQDVLHDAAGADEAFRDAITLAPDAPFREDAEARRVAVLDTSGNLGACVTARDAYLARYPSGIHAATVARQCKAR